MDGRAWWAKAHRIAKSWTRLSNLACMLMTVWLGSLLVKKTHSLGSPVGGEPRAANVLYVWGRNEAAPNWA